MLIIKNKSEVLYLQLDDILYVEADGNYSNIYLADGSMINSLSYQRAEIAKLMNEQLTDEERAPFVMLGRSYMINTKYVLRIQPTRQILTFCTNRFGTCTKTSIKASTKALDTLIEEMEKRDTNPPKN